MLLRKDDPWLPELPLPDIRNWRVLDAGGRTVGFVQSLAIDPKNMVVEALLTGANDRYPGTDVEIDDGVVRLKRRMVLRHADRPSEKPDEYLRFEEAYRDHFQRVYGHDQDRQAGVAYATQRPAYAFGRAIASDADYNRRPFRSAEEDIRAEYVVRGLTPAYDVAREAVRCGYELAQAPGRYEPSGMEREGMQIIGRDEPASDESARTGSSMRTGEPRDDVRSADHAS